MGEQYTPPECVCLAGKEPAFYGTDSARQSALAPPAERPQEKVAVISRAPRRRGDTHQRARAPLAGCPGSQAEACWDERDGVGQFRSP